MIQSLTKVFLLLVLSAVVGLFLYAQPASVSVDQPFAGDRNVTGQAQPNSAPLTAYDVTGTSRNYLGKSSSVDQKGYFAIAVSPLLTKGQKIIVVDAQGRSSSVAVAIVKTGPAGPGN